MFWVQLVPESSAREKGCCERTDGGGGGGGVLVSVCLGIIYQIYCFLVLLLAAIAPHLALLLPLNPAPIPSPQLHFDKTYVPPMQLKVHSSG